MLRPAHHVVLKNDMNLGADSVQQLIDFYIHVSSLLLYSKLSTTTAKYVLETNNKCYITHQDVL